MKTLFKTKKNVIIHYVIHLLTRGRLCVEYLRFPFGFQVKRETGYVSSRRERPFLQERKHPKITPEETKTFGASIKYFVADPELRHKYLWSAKLSAPILLSSRTWRSQNCKSMPFFASFHLVQASAITITKYRYNGNLP